MATKHNQGPVFKFSIQVPKNTTHARKLDELSNNNLWDEANKKELKSLKDFITFRVLEDHEMILGIYIRIPYHFVYDVKFDLGTKDGLVMGGHRTPDVPYVEMYSGVVSNETI